MDAYSKTWLQLVFPVYLWVLVVLMIIISHYSQRFTNLLGSNPISVLATLILLSYTQVLRTLISASSFADLDYPNNSIRRVWLHDANIDYLLGKHIPLFILAVLFFFFFLPSPSCFFLVSGCRLHIPLEALLMDQQCQVETFHGFIPCSLQTKASLLARTAACASLCSYASICL